MSNLVKLPVIKPTVSFPKLVSICRKRCRSGVVLIGLDPLTAMRCRALLYANTAIAAIDETDSKKARLALERIADAFLHVHDQLAGISWYSWPSTVRAERRFTLRMLDSAMTRAELRRVSNALIQFFQKSSALRNKPVAA